jgi:5-methylcytosine-specific restriction protein B
VGRSEGIAHGGEIAPGENARFWDDCLKGGYICVGWDEVGDLREFESKEAFRAAFAARFLSLYNGNKGANTKKSNELWTLMELEPGDVVVANKGQSKVLGVGQVIEPGYEFRPERPEFKHTVRVKWDTSYAKDIPAQGLWGVTTVAKVPPDLYTLITRKKGGPTPALPPPPVEKIYSELSAALERKGQVILYGPPGTGKTYIARRFAAWWLLQHGGTADAHVVLGDRERFKTEERRLSTAEISRRVFWAVANPKEWSWDTLFKNKKVEYRQGRLRSNYALMQPGDLVLGYQSTPDRRIVALAKVVSGLMVRRANAEPTIEIEAVARVKDGLSYDELAADPILSQSEPMRFRNQGTLFALTPDEANHALSLLAERQPDLQPFTDAEPGTSPLTRLTFHPSYSYEDFVEGFRPAPTSTGTLSLKLEDGVFKRICREAAAQPNRRFLVLVDEINRANLAKVFGELITLLEKDKRGLTITLPQSKESFAIPPNVYVLGTMNTADRSIKLLDAALRRRFAFIECMPDTEVLRGTSVNGLALDVFLEELNKRIASHEGREKQIGHAYLLEEDRPIDDPEAFARRFRQDILPLLQEYCYDDYAQLKEYLGNKLVTDSRSLNHDCLSKAEDLIEALRAALAPTSTGGA